MLKLQGLLWCGYQVILEAMTKKQLKDLKLTDFPEEIDTDKTEAKLEHGVLKIHAPKRYTEKDAKKKLTVK